MVSPRGFFSQGFQQNRVRSNFSASVWFEMFALLGCYAALVDSYRYFGPTYRSQLQGSSNTTRMTRMQKTDSSWNILLRLLYPWRWKR